MMMKKCKNSISKMHLINRSLKGKRGICYYKCRKPMQKIIGLELDVDLKMISI